MLAKSNTVVAIVPESYFASYVQYDPETNEVLISGRMPNSMMCHVIVNERVSSPVTCVVTRVIGPTRSIFESHDEMQREGWTRVIAQDWRDVYGVAPIEIGASDLSRYYFARSNEDVKQAVVRRFGEVLQHPASLSTWLALASAVVVGERGQMVRRSAS